MDEYRKAKNTYQKHYERYLRIAFETENLIRSRSQSQDQDINDKDHHTNHESLSTRMNRSLTGSLTKATKVLYYFLCFIFS